jgi:hypothetical protein
VITEVSFGQVREAAQAICAVASRVRLTPRQRIDIIPFLRRFMAIAMGNSGNNYLADMDHTLMEFRAWCDGENIDMPHHSITRESGWMEILFSQQLSAARVEQPVGS